MFVTYKSRRFVPQRPCQLRCIATSIFKSSQWHNGFLIECICTKFPTSILQHQWRWCKKAGEQLPAVKRWRWPSTTKHRGYFFNWCWGSKLCVQNHPYENKCGRTSLAAVNLTLCLPQPVPLRSDASPEVYDSTPRICFGVVLDMEGLSFSSWKKAHCSST